MSKFFMLLLFGMFFLLGCSTSSEEPEITQREKEEQILARFEEDFFVDSVKFDEDNKVFEIVSDYHVRAFTKAKSGEDLETRNGKIIPWEDYIQHYTNSYFNGGGSNTHFSFEIMNVLGEGYTVKEVTSEGKVVFIAKDGELIYCIVNGHAN